MDPAPFDRFNQTLESQGVEAALDCLLAEFKEAKDYHRVFETLAMRARHALGIPIIQSSTAPPIEGATREAYEDKIIAACRETGELFLRDGRIVESHQYYRMVGDDEPLRRALDAYQPKEDESIEGIIEIALGQLVHPARGLAFVLERYGTCQAITACEGVLARPTSIAARQDCIRLLVRRLHQEVLERVAYEIEQVEGKKFATQSVAVLLEGRDWLFENDNYHVDTSHLNAVIRMARLLPRCEEVFLAMQLCEYGRRLSERYRYPDIAPFENVYEDSLIYFKGLVGIEVDKAVAHFHAKAEKSNLDEVGSFPIEVYVNLLMSMGRTEEAIAYAGRRLNDPGARTTLSINELCASAGRLDKMAQFARRRDDLLSYAAARIAERSQATTISRGAK